MLRRLVVLPLLAALTLVGLAVVPAHAGDSAVLRVSKARILTSEGETTRVRLTSQVGPLDGRVVIRRAGGPRVASWKVDDRRSLRLRWDGTDNRGKTVRPGLYRVRAVVHPDARPDKVTRVSRTVRVVGPAGGYKTRYGYVKVVEVRRKIDRYHLEVHERKNQLLVVNRRNAVVRQIPVAGNPAIHKPARSYVADRVRMSYDYDWTKRLPWFVRLVHGRGIGSHTIPRYISDGRPTMPVWALGRAPGVHAPVSAGCLRMHDANARWVFDNVPAGTPVYWL